jgi:hypothetical protein
VADPASAPRTLRRRQRAPGRRRWTNRCEARACLRRRRRLAQRTLTSLTRSRYVRAASSSYVDPYGTLRPRRRGALASGRLNSPGPEAPASDPRLPRLTDEDLASPSARRVVHALRRARGATTPITKLVRRWAVWCHNTSATSAEGVMGQFSSSFSAAGCNSGGAAPARLRSPARALLEAHVT